MFKLIRRFFQMADFTGVNAKLDALKVEVDKVVAKVMTPPVEDPTIQAGIDAVTAAVSDAVDKLTAVDG